MYFKTIITIPKPILKIKNLEDLKHVLLYRSQLYNINGLYSVLNKINGRMYIGSSTNLYRRLLDHIKNNRSNIPLQNAIKKYSIDNFEF